MLGVLIQMSLRGTGDSLTPLWFMLLSVLIDSSFNPLLIEGHRAVPAHGDRRLGDRDRCWPGSSPRPGCSSMSIGGICRSGCAAMSCAT